MGRSRSRSMKSPATSTCSNKLLGGRRGRRGGGSRFDLAEEFGRAEGEAFISGNGVKKPLGLLNDTGLSFTVSGSAAVIADADGGANGLIDLFYALAPFYRQRGVFMANGKTIAALRKLKDGQKQYLWQPSIAVGQPETFLGPSDRRGGGSCRTSAQARSRCSSATSRARSDLRPDHAVAVAGPVLAGDDRPHALSCPSPRRRSRGAARGGAQAQDRCGVRRKSHARLRTQCAG